MRIMTIKFSLCYSFEPETKDIRDEKEEKVRLCVCTSVLSTVFQPPRAGRTRRKTSWLSSLACASMDVCLAPTGWWESK